MCGVVGGIVNHDIVSVVLQGLSRLEYRGYDSAGIAVINQHQQLQRERAVNRVKNLIEQCGKTGISGKIGIGHTRWATHGRVSEANAHPHFSHNRFAIVHNGIIENHTQKREFLQKHGYQFDSETDTEVMVHLIHFYAQQGHKFLQSVQHAIADLTGAYALGVISLDNPDEIICASMGAPLLVAYSEHGMYFASDIAALLPVSSKVTYLQDGNITRITLDNCEIFNRNLEPVKRDIVISKLSASIAELGNYRHYMQKEIFEQPMAIAETLNYLGKPFDLQKFGENFEQILSSIDNIQIIACGTSYNAACVARYWFEDIAQINCVVDIASEYRYRKVVPNSRQLIISISQSGETADTIACIKYAHQLGMTNTLSICNVAESSLARICKFSILTQAGTEIGVASTKAFTTQLVVLLYLANAMAKIRGYLSPAMEQERINALWQLPQLVLNSFELEPQLIAIAEELRYKEHALFIGRNTMYPIVAEGALKLKELSYIHAESYAAGELKHGPLSLIDRNMPVFVLMPQAILADKVKSNTEEVLARQGQVYLFTDSCDAILDKCYKNIELKTVNTDTYLLPVIYTIPLQLLSYHTALAKGTDVDKPRNLAKSVTVE